MNTKEQPLISVIAPVYNVKKYLPEFLDSMLAQTYQNFELLLVDDGSTDGGLEVLQYYAAQDARLHIFCKENGGVASARNFGLEQARGEYIGFVDPDDAVLPQYLARLYAALAEQDAIPPPWRCADFGKYGTRRWRRRFPHLCRSSRSTPLPQQTMPMVRLAAAASAGVRSTTGRCCSR